MNRFVPLGLAVTLLVSASACSMFGQRASKESLTKALEAHAESVRWGGVRGLENTRGQRITDFEVRSVRFDDPDSTKATVRVEVQGYGANQTLRTWVLEQKWITKEDNWLVVSERELKAPAKGAAKPGHGKTAALPAPRP